MKTNPLQQQIAISILRLSGNKKLKSLLDNGNTIDDFFFPSEESDFSRLEKYHFASPLKRNEALQIATKYLPYFEDSTMELLYYKNKDYPWRLQECEDAPLTLFKKGNFDLNSKKVVAIVGTRNISDYGKSLCDDVIRSFEGKDVLVVSGLAYGVDVYTHQLCLKYNVPTVGVLGHGFNFMYPAIHRGIAREMQQNGGLLTEFLPDIHADRIHFPMRNRIIAGLADATIVIESGKKGGSLITADLANGYNRDVFAFPGRVFDEFSQGCNQLIKRNQAMLINSGAEFLEMMNWDIGKQLKKEQPTLFESAPNLQGDELLVYQYIRKKKEVLKDELMNQFSNLSTNLFSILLNIEMGGYVQATPRGTYMLK